MEDWVRIALSQWDKEKLKVNLKATIADIEKAELSLNFKFPDDFKELYLIVNGFSDYEWRSNLFSIWSLERIVNEYDVSDGGFIGFCDYSICVFMLGFHKNKPGIYRNYPSFKESEAEFVINSFKETIDLVNADSALLY